MALFRSPTTRIKAVLKWVVNIMCALIYLFKLFSIHLSLIFFLTNALL